MIVVNSASNDEPMPITKAKQPKLSVLNCPQIVPHDLNNFRILAEFNWNFKFNQNPNFIKRGVTTVR